MNSADAPAIRCHELVRLYDGSGGRVQAVRGVDLTIASGSTSAVVGPSGSGKSSLLRMIAGIDRPTAGSVEIDGVDLWRLDERRRRRRRAELVTLLHQRPGDNLFDHLPAHAMLERSVADRGRAAAVAADWLERMGLEHRRDHLPATMSGGERQRLAFARAAVSGHRVVVADEPTSQLDDDSSTAVLDGIATLGDAGISVLVATHDVRVLDRVDDVLAIRDGTLATVTRQGETFAVIDGAGRVRLPQELLADFPDGLVRIGRDADGRIVLEEP